MNGAQAHLLVNHLPLFGLLFGMAVIGWGVLRRTSAVTRVGLVLVLVGGVGAGLALQSGEAAEDVLEPWPHSHDTLEAHEEAGKIATAGTALAALLALGTLFLGRKEERLRAGALATLALGLVSFALTARAAHLGGQIRHPEIVEGASPPAASPASFEAEESVTPTSGDDEDHNHEEAGG